MSESQLKLHRPTGDRKPAMTVDDLEALLQQYEDATWADGLDCPQAEAVVTKLRAALAEKSAVWQAALWWIRDCRDCYNRNE
jgi:hypothetical protein